MSSDSSGSGPGTLLQPSRRRFVQGLAAGGAIASLGLWPKQTWAMKSPGQPTVLAGTDFNLAIGETPMNFTGATRNAVTVNGSLPGPILRWREGTTVNLRVANQLPPGSIHGHATSIHWHGILLPANMDGVPGLSFNGIHPGEAYQYRFNVHQAALTGTTAIRRSRNRPGCTAQSSSTRSRRNLSTMTAITSCCCPTGPTLMVPRCSRG